LDYDSEGQRKVERNNQLIRVLVKVPPVHPMSPTEIALLDCRRPLPLGDVIGLTLTLLHT
jgi:hypothetical protein